MLRKGGRWLPQLSASSSLTSLATSTAGWSRGLRHHGSPLSIQGIGATSTLNCKRYFADETKQQTSTAKGKIKTQADAVVIGGGALGCSVAYHLSGGGPGGKKVGDVVLLERTELTAGSTWHAAGLVTYFNGGNNLRFVHYYSLNLYPELEKETGQAMGYHRVDSIRMIDTKERMEEALHQMGKAKLYPARTEFVTPEEIKRRHPLVNTEGLLAGIMTFEDGHIDPSSVANAFAMGAKARGTEIYKNTEVQQLIEHPNGTWDVVTDSGTINTKMVINCAGLWGDKVGNMAGVHTPVVPIKHQYVLIGPIPEVIDYQKQHGHQLPVLRDLGGSYYIRQERDGLLVGPYENEKVMQICEDWARTGIPKEWGMDLFAGDLERIMPHIEHSMYRVPCVANGNIRQVINGPVSWAPDGYPLVGPALGKKNFWQCCAASYGIAHAGGIGKYLVDWIRDGEPPYELTEIDPTRYGEWTTKQFVIDKVKETYGFNNHVVYPYEERFGARPVKMNPLYNRLKERGCQFGFHNGWETPNWFAANEAGKNDHDHYQPSYRRANWFETVGKEVKNVCENVGIMDLSGFSKFMISGSKSKEFLERICANNMPKVGKVNISHMLTPKGRMYAELTISRLTEDKFYVVTGSNMERHDLRWFQHQLWQMEEDKILDKRDVVIENVTGRMGVLGVVGPKSREILERLSFTDMSDAKFQFLDCKEMEVASSPLLGIRISFTGELGWELHHNFEYTLPLYEAILKAGKECNIADFGGYAQNSLRLEKGFRLLGTDMTKDHTALEAGLEPRFVKLNKKIDFIGKQALLKQKADGEPKKKSVCFTVDTSAVNADPIGNEPAIIDGKVVGYTTSGGYGWNVKQSIALGYVDTPYAEPGTKLEIEILGQKCKATIAKEPLVDTEPVRSKKAKTPA